MRYQIIIEIDEEDTVTLETKGFKGSECVEEVRELTKNVAPIESSQRTREYYEKCKTRIRSALRSVVSK